MEELKNDIAQMEATLNNDQLSEDQKNLIRTSLEKAKTKLAEFKDSKDPSPSPSKKPVKKTTSKTDDKISWIRPFSIDELLSFGKVLILSTAGKCAQRIGVLLSKAVKIQPKGVKTFAQTAKKDEMVIFVQAGQDKFRQFNLVGNLENCIQLKQIKSYKEFENFLSPEKSNALEKVVDKPKVVKEEQPKVEVKKVDHPAPKEKDVKTSVRKKTCNLVSSSRNKEKFSAFVFTMAELYKSGETDQVITAIMMTAHNRIVYRTHKAKHSVFGKTTFSSPLFKMFCPRTGKSTTVSKPDNAKYVDINFKADPKQADGISNDLVKLFKRNLKTNYKDCSKVTQRLYKCVTEGGCEKKDIDHLFALHEDCKSLQDNKTHLKFVRDLVKEVSDYSAQNNVSLIQAFSELMTDIDHN